MLGLLIPLVSTCTDELCDACYANTALSVNTGLTT